MIRRLAVWTGLRHARREPALSLLALAGIAIGVAVFVAVQTANSTVIRTFAATVDAIAGRANLEIAGGANGLPDSLILKVRRVRGILAATPLVSAYAALPDHPGLTVEIIGVDPFSNAPFRSYAIVEQEDGTPSELLRWIADPRGALAPERLARTLGLAAGDSLRILIGTEPETLTVHGLLRFEGPLEHTAESLLVLDLAAAQEIAGKIGRLDRIELLSAWPDESTATIQAALADSEWPPDAVVRRPGARSAQVETMLAAFRLNLTALSLVSLFVGVFLVGNAASTSVLRRRREIGILRALGTSRGTIRNLVLAENLILGIVGVGAGLGLGLVLARVVLDSVARTVSALYIQVAVRELFIAPRDLAVAAGAGMAAVLAGAWAPALEAAGLEPQRVLSEGRYPTPRRLRIGWLLAASAGAYGLAAAVAASRLSARHPGAGFAAALFILLAGALAAPAATAGIAAAARPLVRSIVSARLAAGQLRAGLPRAAPTVAALGSAVAMVVGVSIMVESFRRTVDLWIVQTVRADLYVAATAQRVAGAGAVLGPEVLAAAESLPGVRAVDRLRMFEVQPLGRGPGDTGEGGERRARGSAVNFSVLAQESTLYFRTGESGAILQGAAATAAVVVSEPFSRHHRLAEGDTLRLATPSGPRAFPIAGVFTDYSSDAGVVLIDLEQYRRWWRDAAVNSLALYLEEGMDAGAAGDSLRARVPGHSLLIRSHRDIRQAALAQFDQTFAVTATLRLITMVMAWAGVFFTLTAGVAERRSEIGILRAMGAVASQIRRAVLAEAVLIALAALVVGAVTGVALALLLVFVINKQFFGWTILWVLTPRPFVGAIGAVLAAALAAAWLPGRAATETDPAASLREE